MAVSLNNREMLFLSPTRNNERTFWQLFFVQLKARSKVSARFPTPLKENGFGLRVENLALMTRKSVSLMQGYNGLSPKGIAGSSSFIANVDPYQGQEFRCGEERLRLFCRRPGLTQTFYRMLGQIGFFTGARTDIGAMVHNMTRAQIEALVDRFMKALGLFT